MRIYHVYDAMELFNKYDFEVIKDNLAAFLHNVNYCRIEEDQNGVGYYVFTDESDSWTQYCYDLNYLNGWLYGVVQGLHHKVNAKTFNDSELDLYVGDIIRKDSGYREREIFENPHIYIETETRGEHHVVECLAALADEEGHRDGFSVDLMTKKIVG